MNVWARVCVRILELFCPIFKGQMGFPETNVWNFATFYNSSIEVALRFLYWMLTWKVTEMILKYDVKSMEKEKQKRKERETEGRQGERERRKEGGKRKF
jgi:hypothetical protein